MFGLSFKTGLKNRVLWTLLILVFAIFLGLFLAVRLFISKPPTTEFLVSSTWCSILTREVLWMFEENESFTQRTIFFDQYSRRIVFESGSWNLKTTQHEGVEIKITWHESQNREGVEQHFYLTTDGADLLRASGDFYGFGEEHNKIFHRCNDPR